MTVSMIETNGALTTVGADRLHTVQHQLLRRGVTHFLPDATLTISGPAVARLQPAPAGAQHVRCACAGSRCECRRAHRFSRSERRLLAHKRTARGRAVTRGCLQGPAGEELA